MLDYGVPCSSPFPAVTYTDFFSTYVPVTIHIGLLV
jgi:hypothetical protein